MVGPCRLSTTVLKYYKYRGKKKEISSEQFPLFMCRDHLKTVQDGLLKDEVDIEATEIWFYGGVTRISGVEHVCKDEVL